MTSERWQLIARLYDQALEMEPRQRETFLAAACGADADLRREVIELLSAHEHAVHFMAGPVMSGLKIDRNEPMPDRVDSVTQEYSFKSATTKILDPPRSVSDLAPGVILAERYQIESELGRGGAGVVLLARDLKLQRTQVVIKALLESWHNGAQRAWIEKKFRQEIAALARINHPGVVRALDVGELPDGRLWLAMQYVPGVTLRSVIRPYGLDFKQTAELMRQIGSALAVAHEQGVIHRDLKPENIMLQKVGAEDHVRLIDFGIASVADTPTNDTTTVAVGTPAYMAPEQLRGKPSPASDIYALGVIAYEMITGRRPFNPESSAQLLELQRAGVEVLPAALRPELPRKAQDAILKALSFKQQERHRSAVAFTEALADALTNENSVPARDRKLDWGIYLPIALMVIMVVALIVWSRGRSVTAPPTLPEHVLSYSLTVWRDPARYRDSQPFSLAREILLGPGDKVRLHLTTPRDGYLYVTNETPRSTDVNPEFRILFPYALTGQASARITAWQPVQIPHTTKDPEQDWFALAEQTGTEKVWLVLAESEIPTLEGVKHLANPDDLGVVKDAVANRSIAGLLAEQAASGKVETSREEKATIMKCQCTVLVGLIKLEHR